MELIEKQTPDSKTIYPSDWIELNLGESSILKARIGWQGLTTAEYLHSGKFYLITGTDFLNGFIDWDNCVYVKKDRYDQDKNIQVKSGDVLVTKDGTIGKVAYIEDVPLPTTLNSGVFVIRPKNEDYHPRYFYHLLMSEHFKDFLGKLTAGSTISHLYQKDFVHYSFPAPPTLSEQKAIATALSDVDALISSLELLIAKKKAIKQGAMQELLTPPQKGGKRLPGFSGEWVEKTIGKIGSTYGGLSGKSKRDFEDGKYPYITFLNVMNNTVIDTAIFEYVNLKPGEHQNKARKGDLFFNTSSETPEEVGMCAILNHDIDNLYLNSFCFGFRLKDESGVDGLFFSYLINSSIGRNLFLSLAQGATRYNLSKNNFNKLEIIVPHKNEQKAIAQILSDMDAELEALEEKKTKYQDIKQGMMQELLTGKTRLV